jgi:hypothetical protein
MEPSENELLDSLSNYDTGLLIKKYGNVNEGHAEYVGKLRELAKIANSDETLEFLAKIRIAAEDRLIDYFVQYEDFRLGVLDAIRPLRVKINAHLESSLLKWLNCQYEHPESLLKFEKDGYGAEKCAALFFPEKLHLLIKTLDEIVTSDGGAISEKTVQFLAQLDCDIKNDTGKYGETRDWNGRYGVFRYSTKYEMEKMPGTVREMVDAQNDTRTLEKKESPLSKPSAAAQPDHRKPIFGIKRILGG